MVIVLMAVLAQALPSSCLLRPEQACVRGGARSFVASTIEVGDRRFALLSHYRSSRNVGAVIEYRVGNKVEEEGCTEPPHFPLEALRTTRGQNRAYQSLCDGRMMDSGQIHGVDDLVAHDLDQKMLEMPRPIAERAKCPLVGRTFQKTADGFVAGAIEVCPEGTESAQYIVSFDRDAKLVRAACDSRLPEDGTHVTKLRYAPFKVSKDELVFSDACTDTAQWAETVTYRLDADGRLWRSSTARRSKPLR